MQPVSLLMSNLNVTSETSVKYAPNAGAAAQDTGQSQEIVREGIRRVQTVQASEAMSKSQRVHRKNENDDQDEHEGRGRDSRDSFERTKSEVKAENQQDNNNQDQQLIHKNIRSKKSFEFLA